MTQGKKTEPKPKPLTKQDLRDRSFHLRHGFAPNGTKGVEILSAHPRPEHQEGKGVEIIEQRGTPDA